jgi:integrase
MLEQLREKAPGASESKAKRKSDAGQIIARGKRKWLVRIYRGADASGKRIYLNTTIKGNKKAAQDYLSRTLTAISNGTFVERSSLTLNEYLEKWYEEAVTGKVRTRTLEDYQSLMERYVTDGLGKKRLTDLRPLDISALYSGMEQQGLSARTIRDTGTISSAALKQASRWGMLALIPARWWMLLNKNDMKW